MENGIVVLGIFAILALFSVALPPKNHSAYSEADLPQLRKRFAPLFIVLIILNFVVLVSSLLGFSKLFPGENDFRPIAISAFVVGGFPRILFGITFFKKSPEWKDAFRSYLDLSYRMDYFGALKVVTSIVILIGFAIFFFNEPIQNSIDEKQKLWEEQNRIETVDSLPKKDI